MDRGVSTLAYKKRGGEGKEDPAININNRLCLQIEMGFDWVDGVCTLVHIMAKNMSD